MIFDNWKYYNCVFIYILYKKELKLISLVIGIFYVCRFYYLKELIKL